MRDHPAARAARPVRDSPVGPPHAWDDIDNNPHDSTDEPTADPIIDDVAVERAMNGQPIRLTPTERRDAVARLTRRGLSAGASPDPSTPPAAPSSGVSRRQPRRRRLSRPSAAPSCPGSSPGPRSATRMSRKSFTSATALSSGVSHGCAAYSSGGLQPTRSQFPRVVPAERQPPHAAAQYRRGLGYKPRRRQVATAAPR